MKSRYVAFAILLGLLCSVVFAEDNETYKNILIDDFERTGVKGRLSSEQRMDGLDVSYFSPSLNRRLHYFVPKFDECSSTAIYEIPGTRQVAIDGSCFSQGGQIYTNVYQWKAVFSDWCLVREITGERADDTSGRPRIANSISHTTGCILIGQLAP